MKLAWLVLVGLHLVAVYLLLRTVECCFHALLSFAVVSFRKCVKNGNVPRVVTSVQMEFS